MPMAAGCSGLLSTYVGRAVTPRWNRAELCYTTLATQFSATRSRIQAVQLPRTDNRPVTSRAISITFPRSAWPPHFHREAYIENSVHETEKFSAHFALSSCKLKVAVVSSFRGTSRQ
jgi:hypothetical protein